MGVTNFPNGISSFGNVLHGSGALGVGNVYYVTNRSQASSPGKYAAKKYARSSYSNDGSMMLHTTIASAAAVCVSDRNDYIIVLPSGYGLTTTIDLSSVQNVHLLGANGCNQDCGSQGSAYLVQTGAYPAITLGSWNEVADLQIWNCSGEEGIYASLKQGINVHHNLFRLTAAAGITSGVDLSGGYGNNYNRVAYNKFIHYAGTAGYAVINVGLGTGNDTIGNEIAVYGSCTYDYGILNQSPGGLADLNRITECGGSGTITVALQIKSTNGNSASGNFLAVAAGQGLAGGTAEKSFCQNFDAASGGATAIQT